MDEASAPPQEVPTGPPARDDRAYYAVAALAALLALALAVPAGRAWLATEVWASIRGQADPGMGARLGYTTASLAFWAAIGAVLAWAAYETLFRRLRIEPGRPFLAALLPYLAIGPLLHALLVADAIPKGGALAYLAAEPLVYLTVALLALGGFAAGALRGNATTGALVVGLVALAPLIVMAAIAATPVGLQRAGILLGGTVALAGAVGYAYHRFKPNDDAAIATAVIGAHALDGFTTWMVLRDPFGIGFHSFSEQNPVSRVFVEMSNGWPYLAIKLLLPVGLLLAVKREKGEDALNAFLMLAIFVLGYGPGMSNLLQVLFS